LSFWRDFPKKTPKNLTEWQRGRGFQYNITETIITINADKKGR
jgi:hypothetical protein